MLDCAQQSSSWSEHDYTGYQWSNTPGGIVETGEQLAEATLSATPKEDKWSAFLVD
jgi:ADP-ribose pyrophosphatase YjhB (NUDIX family)